MDTSALNEQSETFKAAVNVYRSFRQAEADATRLRGELDRLRGALARSEKGAALLR